MVTSETIISVFAKHEDLFLVYRTLLKRQSTLCLKRSECDSKFLQKVSGNFHRRTEKMAEFTENGRFDSKNGKMLVRSTLFEEHGTSISLQSCQYLVKIKGFLLKSEKVHTNLDL